MVVSSLRTKVIDDYDNFLEISQHGLPDGVLQATLFSRSVYYGRTLGRPRLFEYMEYV
jgi:hypothetical protein